jgi:two-component system LytT family response regulator
MIRALIIDDESVARRRISRLLSSETNIEVIGECSTGLQALSVIEKESPELLFLDVEMPEMNGFDLLAQLNQNTLPAVIFTTAFDKYAVRAFENHAMDYVLKPIDSTRFHDAIEHARSHLKLRARTGVDNALLKMIAEIQKDRVRIERIVVKQPGRAFFVKVATIDWFEAADNYVRIHVGPETHLVRESMNAIEARLDPDRFVRIHRSTVVNIDRIKEIQSFFQGSHVVVLATGQKLKLSRNYRDKLEVILNHSR